MLVAPSDGAFGMIAADALDFVVIDVEAACSRVSSICQVGIVGFHNGAEVFAYESLVDPCDDFSSFNVRIHGIESHHVEGQPTFADVHETISSHLTGRITVAQSYFDKGALGPLAAYTIDRRSRTAGSTASASPNAPGHILEVIVSMCSPDL